MSNGVHLTSDALECDITATLSRSLGVTVDHARSLLGGWLREQARLRHGESRFRTPGPSLDDGRGELVPLRRAS
jgi:hypothetical protein